MNERELPKGMLSSTVFEKRRKYAINFENIDTQDN